MLRLHTLVDGLKEPVEQKAGAQVLSMGRQAAIRARLLPHVNVAVFVQSMIGDKNLLLPMENDGYIKDNSIITDGIPRLVKEISLNHKQRHGSFDVERASYIINLRTKHAHILDTANFAELMQALSILS